MSSRVSDIFCKKKNGFSKFNLFPFLREGFCVLTHTFSLCTIGKSRECLHPTPPQPLTTQDSGVVCTPGTMRGSMMACVGACLGFLLGHSFGGGMTMCPKEMQDLRTCREALAKCEKEDDIQLSVCCFPPFPPFFHSFCLKKTVEIARLWQHNRGNYTTTIYQKKIIQTRGVYAFSAEDIDGAEVKLSSLVGKVLLVTNVASE